MADIDLALADKARARIPALIHDRAADVAILKPAPAIVTYPS
jgi:hypothetical protein